LERRRSSQEEYSTHFLDNDNLGGLKQRRKSSEEIGNHLHEARRRRRSLQVLLDNLEEVFLPFLFNLNLNNDVGRSLPMIFTGPRPLSWMERGRF